MPIRFTRRLRLIPGFHLNPQKAARASASAITAPSTQSDREASAQGQAIVVVPRHVEQALRPEAGLALQRVSQGGLPHVVECGRFCCPRGILVGG